MRVRARFRARVRVCVRVRACACAFRVCVCAGVPLSGRLIDLEKRVASVELAVEDRWGLRRALEAAPNVSEPIQAAERAVEDGRGPPRIRIPDRRREAREARRPVGGRSGPRRTGGGRIFGLDPAGDPNAPASRRGGPASRRAVAVAVGAERPGAVVASRSTPAARAAAGGAETRPAHLYIYIDR